MRKFLTGAALAVVVASVVAIGVAKAAAPGPDYLDAVSFTAVAKNANTATLSVTSKADIPRHPDAFISANPVVGFAWIDLATARVFVVTIHPVIGRDSHQRPDGWHAHTATLAGGATAPNDLCIASIDSAPTAGISIHGETIKVNVQQSDLRLVPGAFDAAVGFTIQLDSGCSSGLAVRIST